MDMPYLHLILNHFPIMVALWVLLAMGAVGTYSWWRMVRGSDGQAGPVWLRALLLTASLAGAGTVGFAALKGGEIVHKSQRIEAAAAGQDAVNVPREGGEERDGDRR